VCFLFFFDCCSIQGSKQWECAPHTHVCAPPWPHLLPNHYSTASLASWLIVLYFLSLIGIHKRQEAEGPVYHSIGSLFKTPNKGTNSSKSKPNASCLLRNHKEQWMDNFLGRYYIPRQKSWSKKRKKLDTPSRQKYAHLLSTQNATKTLPFHNVRHRRTPHTMMTSALSQHLVGLVMHFLL